MPTTGLPANIWYPDENSPVAPLDNLFLQLANSVNVAFSDLNLSYRVENLAELGALTAVEVGSSAYMLTPGAGIGPVEWSAYAGVGSALEWRATSMVVAGSKAQLDAFASAVIASPAVDATFKSGLTAYNTTNKVYSSWNGTVFNPDDTGWINLSTPGWITNTQPKIKKVNGLIFMAGIIQSSGVQGTVATVPEGFYDPDRNILITITTASTSVSYRGQVSPSGILTIIPSATNGLYIYLDGINYAL